MAGPMGFMASYVAVVFKKDGQETARAQGSIGCIRHGEPQDTLDLLRNAMSDIQFRIKSGEVNQSVLDDYTSVVIGNDPKYAREYTRGQIEQMGRSLQTKNRRPGGPKP